MLDFFIKDFNQSHGFSAKNGLIIGHIGSLFILIFSMWPFFVMCGTMGYLFHVWAGVSVGFFSFFVISICTELLCFGSGIGITCS